MSVVAVWALLAVYSALSDEHAKRVIADEISGVVVEAGSGKPISNAVAAIRFERGNTGHGSPVCFRSMAVQADAQGRFKFATWTQENTRANATFGEVVAYKIGYHANRANSVYVPQSRRELLGVRFNSDIHIPKTEVRVELQPWAGMREDRIEQLGKLVGDFSCTESPKPKDHILEFSVRDEIASSPPTDGSHHHALDWINNWIKKYQPMGSR